MVDFSQGVLDVQLHEDATFSNFYAGKNTQLISHLKQFLKNKEEHFFYLAGTVGSGKSHLLQACCHEITKENKTATYIPLENFRLFNVKLLENLEEIDFIAVDDIQCIFENKEWQIALMNLYNFSKEIKSKLFLCGDELPQALNLTLADLTSRLSWGQVYQLYPLEDEEKIFVLQAKASARGFELSQEVGNFLLRHCSRQMPALFSILEKLDYASLAAQRRLTIPFVKEVLKNQT